MVYTLVLKHAGQARLASFRTRAFCARYDAEMTLLRLEGSLFKQEAQGHISSLRREMLETCQ